MTPAPACTVRQWHNKHACDPAVAVVQEAMRQALFQVRRQAGARQDDTGCVAHKQGHVARLTRSVGVQLGTDFGRALIELFIRHPSVINRACTLAFDLLSKFGSLCDSQRVMASDGRRGHCRVLDEH